MATVVMATAMAMLRLTLRVESGRLCLSSSIAVSGVVVGGRPGGAYCVFFLCVFCLCCRAHAQVEKVRNFFLPCKVVLA